MIPFNVPGTEHLDVQVPTRKAGNTTTSGSRWHHMKQLPEPRSRSETAELRPPLREPRIVALKPELPTSPGQLPQDVAVLGPPAPHLDQSARFINNGVNIGL